MVIKTASPGVIVNEVDLTRGTSDAITTNVGAMCGPFQRGPVDKITLVGTEVDFQDTFGSPTDENYEYWFTVDNFLEYGGVCYVVRCDDSSGGIQTMRNAYDGPTHDVNGNEIVYYVKNDDDFEENFMNVDASMGGLPTKFMSRNPGTWGNNVSIAVIDSGADYEHTLEAGRAYDLTGAEVAGPIYFDKSVELGAEVAKYVKVKASPENVSAPAKFDDVRAATVADVDIATGGIFGTLTQTAGGTGYGTRTGVSQNFVTMYNGAPGSGLVVGTYITNGEITEITGINDGGKGYVVGDTGGVDFSHTFGGEVEIATVEDGTAPADSVAITAAGSGYADATGVATTGGAGSGLTVDITVSGDAIDTVVIADAGDDYENGDIVTVSGGNGDATLMVTHDNVGIVTSVTLLSGGKDYGTNTQDGTVQNGTVEGGTGSGMTVDYTITGGVVGDITIANPGEGYTAGDSITIIGGDKGATFDLDTVSNGEYGGIVVADGDRILLYGQTDPTENGIYIVDEFSSWVRAADADASTDFVPEKVVYVKEGTDSGRYLEYMGVQNPTIGVDDLTFAYWTPYVNIKDQDFVEAYDSVSGGPVATGAKGVIVDVVGDVYKIMVLEGEFNVGDTFSKDGLHYTGAISETDGVGRHVLYSYGAVDELGQIIDERIINTIFVANNLSYEQGLDRGWPAPVAGKQRRPTDGMRVVSTLGDTYIWRNSVESWVLDYEPIQGELFTDGTHVFINDDSDDWYQKQFAFAGIPWFRFAPRPSTTPNSRARGALNDEMHIIVYDRTGQLTGSQGNVIESFYGVSKLRLAKTPEGDNNYYVDVVNRRSATIFANQDVDGPLLAKINEDFDLDAPGASVGDGVNSSFIDAISYNLANGVDQLEATLGELQFAYQKFSDENVEDLDYLLQGPSLSNTDDAISKANFIISIAEELKSCMAFITPPRYAAIEPMKADDITEKVVEFFDKLSSSSYTVFDSGYKFSYDRFNDKQRFMPLNADMAGLLTSTSINAEPWYSPAGVVRGQIRNAVRLSYNPSKEQRDVLYTSRVNPVVTFPGEGTILYGDKTALAYSSAFDRINVRKLFLIIEKEISRISRSVLFEFNDVTTRALFRNNVNPYLRDIQSRRGLTDFLVVCDESNNTPEVIDRNEFVADIYIKPNRSINFVTLNFIATKTGVTFSEAVGLFRR